MQGKLVGNLSRHDLKGVQGGTGFGALNQSIMHYQRKHRVALAQRLVTVTPRFGAVVSCLVVPLTWFCSSTIAEVLSTMAREKVHRVFVVEGGMIPRGEENAFVCVGVASADWIVKAWSLRVTFAVWCVSGSLGTSSERRNNKR